MEEIKRDIILNLPYENSPLGTTWDIRSRIKMIVLNLCRIAVKVSVRNPFRANGVLVELDLF